MLEWDTLDMRLEDAVGYIDVLLVGVHERGMLVSMLLPVPIFFFSAR